MRFGKGAAQEGACPALQLHVSLEVVGGDPQLVPHVQPALHADGYPITDEAAAHLTRDVKSKWPQGDANWLHSFRQRLVAA